MDILTSHVSYVNRTAEQKVITGGGGGRRNDWPARKSLELESKNILRPSLIDSQKSFLPPLYITLGFMIQSVKDLSTSENCF